MQPVVNEEFRERLARLVGESRPRGTGDADVARYRNDPRRCDDVISDHDFRSPPS